MSGNLQINGSVAAALTFNAATSSGQSFFQSAVGGVSRWRVLVGDGAPESGSNSGTNFGLQRFDDTGSIIDTPLTISRATGKVSVNGAPLAPVLPKMLAGLTLANDATTPNTVLDIDVGSACSDDNTTMMALMAAITKNCNAAWAVGSGNGALDSGSALAVSTWYHVYLIERTDTYVVDVLISTSATAPTMPASYTKKRRIGSIKTDASAHIIAFIQLGDQFLWVAPVQDFNGAAVATTLSPTLTTVPTGVKVLALLTVFYVPPAANGLLLVSLDQPTITNSPAGNMNVLSSPAGTWGGSDFQIRTNTSAQIGVAALSTGSSTGYYQITKGWIDYRGK
jgi:hypothetical protein